MPTKSRFIPLAIFLFCLLFCLASVASAAPRLDLVVEYGVDQKSEAQARRAVDTALNFFQNTYGLALERDLQIFLVPNQDVYRNDLIRYYGVSDNKAREVAESSAGIAGSSSSNRPTIIINLGKLQRGQNQFFCLCHELVHHFESQASRDRHHNLWWFSEGVADVLAAHILETAGLNAVVYRNFWQESVKKAPQWPRLESLHTGNDWYNSMAANGNVTYKTAALAVLKLVQWKGYKPLFAYFSALKQTNPEAAFFQAYGIRISDFEKQFTPF